MSPIATLRPLRINEWMEPKMMSKWWMGLALALVLSACGDDGDKGVVIDCSDDEFYDQVNDSCVPRFPDEVNNDAGTTEDTGSEIDMGEPDMSVPDECDLDGDGSLKPSCGGDDCDDNNRRRNPAYPEICDEIDNNCNEQLNDGIVCEFFGHSGSTLYRVDPFKKTATEVGADLPNLQDIDTHPDGTLYGITFDGLYALDQERQEWDRIGDFGITVDDPNGLAIDSRGDLFATGQDKLYQIDRETGEAMLVGPMGEPYYSSGDCVVNKRDTLFMTSKHLEDEDTLMIVQANNAMPMEVGPMGFRQVFGLTSAWGTLFGLTRAGEVIEINSADGASRLIHTFEDISWFGAASTPER